MFLPRVSRRERGLCAFISLFGRRGTRFAIVQSAGLTKAYKAGSENKAGKRAQFTLSN